MAGVALMVRKSGMEVQGSDTAFYPPMGPLLNEHGIVTMPGYRTENITPELDLVVVGNVCRRDNPEVVEAQRLGLKLLSMPQVIKEYFLADRTSLVITGTHGKTTTTALTAWMLQYAGLEPSFLVGGIALNFDSNHGLGKGRHFVIEGDEYDTAFFDKKAKFFHYKPTHALITSLEFDHADIYADLKTIEQAFHDFSLLVPQTGTLTLCTDWATLETVTAQTSAPRIWYGWDSSSQIQAKELAAGPEGTAFLMTVDGGVTWHPALLAMWGRHNVLNALGAASLALQAGCTLQQVIGAMATFKGVKRRQQIVAQEGGVTVVDDFAHHPTAVRETLSATRQRFPGRRILAIYHFESNTSRRKVFQDEYSQAFSGAAEVFLTHPLVKADTLSADQYLDPAAVVAGISGYAQFAKAYREFPELARELAQHCRPGDVILGMSGRDLSPLYAELIPLLRG